MSLADRVLHDLFETVTCVDWFWVDVLFCSRLLFSVIVTLQKLKALCPGTSRYPKHGFWKSWGSWLVNICSLLAMQTTSLDGVIPSNGFWAFYPSTGWGLPPGANSQQLQSLSASTVGLINPPQVCQCCFCKLLDASSNRCLNESGSLAPFAWAAALGVGKIGIGLYPGIRF